MQWYYIVNGRREGPIEDQDIRGRVRGGALGTDDLVWNETMGQEWRPVGAVPELKAELGSAPSPAAPVRAVQPGPRQAAEVISCVNPVTPAWERMKDILFRPFDMGKWFVLGFSAWLATLGEGGGSGNVGDIGDWGDKNGSGDFRTAWESFRVFVAEHSWVIPVAVAGILFVFILGAVLLWLRSRGRFMFLDNVVNNRAGVSEPWAMFKQHGNSLFLWSFVFGLVCFVVFLLLAALTAVTVVLPCLRAGRFLESLLPGMVLLGVVWLLFMIATGLVSRFLEDFVVPVMYINDLTATEAWGKFLPVLRNHAGKFIRYVLFYMLLSVAAGLIVGLIVLATCCIAGCLMVIPYVGAVLLLPVTVFFRLYSLEYLAQYGPDFQAPPALEPA